MTGLSPASTVIELLLMNCANSCASAAPHSSKTMNQPGAGSRDLLFDNDIADARPSPSFMAESDHHGHGPHSTDGCNGDSSQPYRPSLPLPDTIVLSPSNYHTLREHTRQSDSAMDNQPPYGITATETPPATGLNNCPTDCDDEPAINLDADEDSGGSVHRDHCHAVSSGEMGLGADMSTNRRAQKQLIFAAVVCLLFMIGEFVGNACLAVPSILFLI